MSLNNDCVKIQESLNAYIDNEEVDIAEVENHLSGCEHCSDILQKLTEAKTMLINLPPSISPKDFTSELEKKIATSSGNTIPGKFPRSALAAIFIALAGIIGFYALSNLQHNEVEKTVASVPEKIQEHKIDTELKIKVAKEPLKQEIIIKKKKDLTVQIASSPKEPPKLAHKPDMLQTAMQVQPVSEAPVNIALNTSDLSSDNGLFDDMGFGSDEDGLYAIKL